MTEVTNNKPTTKSTSWTFLTNHSHVLICLALQPDMLLREVAQKVGITERGTEDRA